MRRFSFTLLATLLCAAVAACGSTGTPGRDSGKKAAGYDALAIRLYKVRIKSEELSLYPLAKFLAKKLENLNDYFDPHKPVGLFPRIRLKPGTKLAYHYAGSPMWDGRGMVMVMQEGKPVLLNQPETYRNHVLFEKTPEGALEYALLYEELALLTLKQHLNYSQTWFIPSYESFVRICSTKVKLYWSGETGYWYRNLLPTPPDEGKHLEFWTSLEKAAALLKPRVLMEGPVARVSLHRFSPWGGVYRAEYSIHMETGEISQVAGEWSFPIYRTGEYVVPFHCGVMF